MEHKRWQRGWIGGLSLVLWCSLNPVLGGDSTSPAGVRFSRDIRPIFAENCYACHGPDPATRKGDLRLDTEEGAKEEVVVPGKPEESELIRRIFMQSEKKRMPPLASGKQLTERQKALLQQWIAEGAPWESHWAYLPVKSVPAPETKDTSWPRNPIDQFILARLAAEKLRPTVEADKRTLIRRLSFDLTGLPPTPQAVDQFIRDNRPDAYERLVDTLLASPHYGERLAVWWLDLVRYADSVGYHGDQVVSVWPFRDYVIDAFNRNLPFDQFTREQIAGDLLPQATRAQKIASGYNRLGMMSAEGGVQDKEYLAKYAAERVRNVSGAWMGATMGCAECHDHKFDPYTARDFYRMEAFFADLKEKGFYNEGFQKSDWGPSLRLLTGEQQKQLDRIDAEMAVVKQTLSAISDDSLAAARERWELQALAYDAWGRLDWHPVEPLLYRSEQGTSLELKDDDSLVATGLNPETENYTVTIPAHRERITALRVEVMKDEHQPGNELARSGQTFYLSDVEIFLLGGPKGRVPVKAQHVTANVEAEGFPVLGLLDGKPDTAWSNGGGPSENCYAVFHFDPPLQGGDAVRLEVRLRQETRFNRQTMGRFRLALSSLEWAPSGKDGIPEDVKKALKVAPEKRDDGQRDLIRRHYRTIAPELVGPQRYLARLEKERSLLLGEVPSTPIARSVEPRVIRVLPRGNWMDDSGEIVSPGVPHFLTQIDTGTNRATRLDLARWLVVRENPLTARVLVNRLWKLYFGIGLSKSLDDFGTQGEAPVHPALLDWLAADLMDQGWDLKRTIRLLVTSATYRQTSTTTPELDERDPYNRLYARQSRFRLEAELIRDQALAASGLLVDTIGGPSVKPWQPPGYWSALNFPKREYEPGRGADLYRRGLYTHWQRTFLHPALVVFDAPTREECTMHRPVSNTPLQALVLLNDPEYLEAARVLAERVVRQPADFKRQLDFAYSRVLNRVPTNEEVALLNELYQSQHTTYEQDYGAARSLISMGEAPVPEDLNLAELAAWTQVSRTLLNLHETITRN